MIETQHHSNEGKNLIKASALYKNDTTNGIGIIIDNDNNDLEYFVAEGLEAYEKAWEEADENRRKEYISGYFDQLNHYSKYRAKDRSQEENFTCLWNIYFLEKYGFLETDNFNGCTFLYEQK